MVMRSQLSKLGLFDARVPRYTSYPTAPHFGTSVTPEMFGDWIGALPENSDISLYVHVPFCRRLCWFCACRTQGTQSDDPIRAYLQTLKAELALLKSRLPKGTRLSRLHWGGGTPTLLSADMITDLAQTIAAITPFAEGFEFSVEIDPNEADEARLDALSAAGMNRASIGVQDFDPEIQNTIGRIQSFETTYRVVNMLRDRGIDSLNADILYGLPHQSRERITESVQKLLSLNPDRVALYGYAHVPWMAKRQQMIPSDALPRPEDRLELFEVARDLFTWDGYEEIGIDHFARPTDGLAIAQKSGRLRRNFQGYTDDTSTALIGVGASAISKLPQGYAQNAPATSAHTGAIRGGTFSVSRGHEFSADDLLRARIIEMIMCDFQVTTDDLVRDFGANAVDLRRQFDDINRQFDQLLNITADGLQIPANVRPLTRLIARAFDAYDLSKAGHSAAI